MTFPARSWEVHPAHPAEPGGQKPTGKLGPRPQRFVATVNAATGVLWLCSRWRLEFPHFQASENAQLCNFHGDRKVEAKEGTTPWTAYHTLDLDLAPQGQDARKCKAKHPLHSPPPPADSRLPAKAPLHPPPPPADSRLSANPVGHAPTWDPEVAQDHLTPGQTLTCLSQS